MFIENKRPERRSKLLTQRSFRMGKVTISGALVQYFCAKSAHGYIYIGQVHRTYASLSLMCMLILYMIESLFSFYVTVSSNMAWIL